jgi:CDGSH-type Zn-finger protein
MTDDAVTITPLENGPYLVKGPVTVVDADGSAYQIDRSTVALCRCGGSTSKPFCDGTHSKIGFDAAERAVRETDADETPR